MHNTQHIPTTEAAQILNADRRTVHRWADKGTLPFVAKLPGLRGGYLFDRAEVERFAERRSAEAESAAS